MKFVLFACYLMLMLFPTISTAQTAWVIGGQPATEGQFPWLGDIRTFNSHLCGSSLIHPKWVLTAAHCVEDDVIQDINNVRVRFNTINTEGPINPNGGVQSKVTSIFLFPGFDVTNIQNGNDLALLYLTDSISISHANVPYTTDTADKYQDGSNILIAGWGINDTVNLGWDEILQWANARIYPIQECNNIMGSNNPERLFCIGYTGGEDARGAGAGDSGGPAWRMVNNKPVVYGIVSGGTGGSTTLVDQPGIFTKVARYRPWIDSIMTSKGSSTVGIDKVSAQDHFESSIKITMDGYQLQIQLYTTDNQALECGIWDMQGRLVFSRQLQQSRSVQYNIPLAQLASGAYVLRINNNKGQQLIRKIAKH